MYLLTLTFLFTMTPIYSRDAQENNEQPQRTSSSIDNVEIKTTNLGRFQYLDGEVILFQNTLKPSDFFFTPFPCPIKSKSLLLE